MQPKNQNENQLHVSQSRLDQRIDMEHSLVSLAKQVDWQTLTQKLGAVHIPDKGCPAQAQVRKLRTFLGRMLRDTERKATEVSGNFKSLLEIAARVHGQRKEDREKLYSYFAPEVSCIAKGKVHKKYEFGCKASIVSTSCGNWVVGAEVFHGNPFDGHTLGPSLS